MYFNKKCDRIIGFNLMSDIVFVGLKENFISF